MKVSGFAFLLILFLVGNVSCEKETISDAPLIQAQPLLQDILISSKALKVSAGQDVVLSLPLNKVKLSGSLSLQENNLKEIALKWKKIKGPNSYQLDNTNTLDPILSELERGEYWLELTATNSAGLFDVDTTVVFVNDTSAGLNKEMVFINLEWIFPWYAALEIPGIYSYMPVGTSIKVFIQPDANSDWIEVGPISTNPYCICSYEYLIETRQDGAGIYNFGSLYIFNYDYRSGSSNTSKVKIIF